MSKQQFFALHTKGAGLSFSYPSKTSEDFEDALRTGFSLWKGMKPKGSNPQMEDFMKNKKRVIVTVEIVTP